MNTRLQVEHPVTEAITGLDLVELQIRAATSLPLGVAQDSVAFAGHAIEVRINAEDATNDFAPQIGQVTVLDVPDSVRWDAAIELGSTITPHYDPMIAKLIVHAATREAPSPVFAMVSTGSSSVASSPMAVSTAGWSTVPSSRAGRITTRFLDETELPSTTACWRRPPSPPAQTRVRAMGRRRSAVHPAPTEPDRCHARPPRQRS